MGNFLDAIKDKWIENCYEVSELYQLYAEYCIVVIAANCTLLYKYVLFFKMIVTFACYFRQRVLSTGPPWLSTSCLRPSGKKGV